MVKRKKTKIKQRKNKAQNSFDIPKIKKAIKEELYFQYTIEEKKKSNNLMLPSLFERTYEEEEREYYNRYSKYMAEEFNSTIVNMLIIFINKNKNLPMEYQKESNFINKFINLIKNLLMNEFELSCFTILLDKMGLKYSKLDHWTYFCILGIYTKKICGREEESSSLINIFSNKNTDFITNYTKICDEEIAQKIEENSISLKVINERYRQLTKTVNSYCRKNYINYNGVADKIVKLSQPYGEQSNGNQLYCSEQLNENNNNIDLCDNLIKENNIYNNEQKKIVPPNLNNELLNFKNDIFLQPAISNGYNELKNFNNLYMNQYSIYDLNNINQYNPSLNLVNRGSSQFSLILENNLSNNNLNI